MKPVVQILLVCLLTTLPAAAEPAPSTLADRLRRSYVEIKSLSCRIRKTTRGADQTVRMLSRIHYRAPNKVHVDNISPVRRRIIVDGERLYYHEDGAARGFSRAVAELDGRWVISAHNVPGTPLEHLLNLQGVSETPLAASAEYPVRVAYHLEKASVVLSCNSDERLELVEFFTGRELEKRTAEYRYDAFEAVGERSWIPRVHRVLFYMPNGKTITETRRIDSLVVNEPVADNLFDPDLFFPEIEFVSDFKKTYAP